jgi:hypothetical protein
MEVCKKCANMVDRIATEDGKCFSCLAEEQVGRKDDEGKVRWSSLMPMNIWAHICWLHFTFIEKPIGYTEKIKLVNEKDWCLLAACLLEELDDWADVARVFHEGAEKHGDNNWQSVVNGKARYEDALCRHLLEDGVNEKDFGLPHIAHAIWNFIALDWFTKEAPVWGVKK